jgi:hypothetical protein
VAEEPSKSLDVLGIRPVTEAFSHAAKAAIDGASSFLGRICLPAAEEFGLLLQDKVRSWRAKNAIVIVCEAEARFQKYKLSAEAHAHPRLVAAVLEHGSWSDDKTAQDMWAGLLASSCSQDGRDESNLIFINLLAQLTGVQVRVLNYGCEKVEKEVTAHGLIVPKESLYLDVPTLQTIAGTADIPRLDRELDNLRGLELIHHGFFAQSSTIDIMPSALALNLYVRCQGFTGPPADYFKLTAAKKD